VHSYRGGTGKSNVTANVAACAMEAGKKVAVLDTDLQSPGVHVLFGMEQEAIKLTLVDFLWGRCTIGETAYDVTRRINPETTGRCWLVPASLTTRAITRILDEGYDVSRLNQHFDQLLSDLELDLLFIDTHPGLNKETMLTTAISDALVILIRPDQQDYYGTAVLAEIANKLEVPHKFLVANKIFSHVNEEQLRKRLQETFGYEVIGMIPLHEDLARLESRTLITRAMPDHEISHVLRGVAGRLADLP
jgi:MinD-like ATPase involved in chromosome partitioning or flagellar assembly